MWDDDVSGSHGRQGGVSEPGLDAGPENVGRQKVAAPSCPRCDAPMQDGFLAPKNAVNRAVLPVDWHSGPSRWSVWWGSRPGRVNYPVQAFRCDGCGRLEFYARG